MEPNRFTDETTRLGLSEVLGRVELTAEDRKEIGTGFSEQYVRLEYLGMTPRFNKLPQTLPQPGLCYGNSTIWDSDSFDRLFGHQIKTNLTDATGAERVGSDT